MRKTKKTAGRILALLLTLCLVSGLLVTAALADQPVPQPVPEASFEATGWSGGNLTGLIDGEVYSVTGAGTMVFTAAGTTQYIDDLYPGTLYLVREGDNVTTVDSAPQEIVIGKAAKPSGVTVSACTSSANNDGVISGVTSAILYKTYNSGTWNLGTGSDITGLIPGIYCVRTAASGSTLASDEIMLLVDAYTDAVSYGISINGTQITSANAANVFATGSNANKVTYDAAANRITITGMFIGPLAVRGNGSTDIYCDGGTNIAIGSEFYATGVKDIYVTAETTGAPVINAGTEGMDVTCSGNVSVTAAGHGFAVSGPVRVTGAKNVTFSAPASSTTPVVTGYADISCSGDLKIENKGSSMALGGALTVRNAANVTVLCSSSSPLIPRTVDISCTGNVELKNDNGFVTNSSLTVRSAKNVSLTGTHNAPVVISFADITCSGDLLIENKGVGPVVGKDLKVTGAKAVALKCSSLTAAVAGDADISCTGDLSVENGKGACVGGSLSVKGAGNVKFEGFPDNVPVIEGNTEIACTGDVEIYNGYIGPLVNSGLTVTKAKKVCLRAKTEAPAVNGDAYISCSDTLHIDTFDNVAVNGNLTVVGATDVYISGDTTAAPVINGITDISCSGDVTIINNDWHDVNTVTGFCVNGALKIKGAEDVAISNMTERSSSPVVKGNVTIDCSGDIYIATPSNCIAVNGTLTVTSADGIELGNKSVYPVVTGPADITCSGDLEACNGGTGIVFAGGLTVRKADSVSIHSDSDTGMSPVIVGGAVITCDGDLQITSAGTGFASAADLLVYNANSTYITSCNTDCVINGKAGFITTGNVLMGYTGTGKAVKDTVSFAVPSGAGAYEICVEGGDSPLDLETIAELGIGESFGPQAIDAKVIRIDTTYLGVHEHDFETEWSYDANNHWHSCVAGDTMKDRNAHEDSDNDGKCDVCGCVMSAAPATPSVPVVTPAENKLPFTDVAESDWFYADVEYVYNAKLMNGTSDTTFEPALNASRAMVVTTLYRLAGSPAVTGENTFEDVDAGTWYTDAVIWAKNSGIVKGYSDTVFGPNDDITREQLATILYNYAKFMGYDVSVGEDTNILSFRDAAQVSGFAVPAVQWAVGANIIKGTDDLLLLPQQGAARAQFAAMLHRFCENVK